MVFNQRLQRLYTCNIPLRWMMIVPFVIQIVGAVGLVGYLSYRSGQDTANQLAIELQKQTSNRVEIFLKNYLATPVLINRINADALRSGQISFQDIPKLESYLFRQLQQFETVSHILVGTEQRVFRVVNRNPAPSLLTSDSIKTSRIYQYLVDRNGHKLILNNVMEQFDLQSRPWYKAAVKAGKPLHVPIFRLSDNSDFSLNSSYPIYAPDGQLLGVFSAASDMSFLHKFMAELQIGKTGRVYVMERNGLLVGDSTANTPVATIEKDGKTELNRIKATDNYDPLIQSTSRYLLSQFKGFDQIKSVSQLEFWEDGDRHFVQVTPYKDDLGLDWLIVVVVHESDFMSNVKTNTQWTILLCGMTLILAIALGVLTAHWISQPILHLSQASDEVAQGKPQTLVSEDSPITEIKTLAKSFNNMITQVYQSFDLVEVALKESQEKYKTLFQSLPIGVSITDMESRIVESNFIAEYWLGTPNSAEIECLANLEINPNVIRPDGSPMPVQEYACVKALQTNTPVYNVETGIVCADDRLRWFSVSASPIPLENYGVVLVHVDISDQKKSEQAMRRSELNLQTFLSNIPIPISIKDLEGKYLAVNPEFAYWMQVSAEDIVGKMDCDFFPMADIKNVHNYEIQAIFEGVSVAFEQSVALSDGIHTFIITKFPLMDENDSPYAVVGISLDISDRKKAEVALAEAEASLREANQELKKLINLDGLTKIANRRCFNNRINDEWQRLHREHQPLSLIMFDVDYFKLYNDLYGHQLGDECLIKIAQAVERLMRRPADLVARYGGEEFIVILPNTEAKGALLIANEIHEAIRELQIPHQHSSVSKLVSVSIGLACSIPNIEQSPDILIKQADQALYSAKQQGRNRSILFTE